MDPATWVYLALLAASTGANYMAQKKVSHEREKAMAAAAMEREIQSKRAEVAAKNTADQLLATKDAEKAKAAQIESSYSAPPTQTPVQQQQLANFAANEPKGSTTVQEASRVGARQGAFRAEQNKLGSQLAAFGDVMLGNQANVERNRQDINAAGSSLNNYNQFVLPAALNAANASGRQWGTAADVMKIAAAIMGPYALATRAASTVTPITQSEVLASTPQYDWGALVNQQVGRLPASTYTGPL